MITEDELKKYLPFNQLLNMSIQDDNTNDL